MKSDLKTQFIQRLNGEDLSLDDRLNIAYGALLSQEFCVNGKEQIVIDWFAQCFKVNVMQAKVQLKMLTKCLASDCLQTFNNTIDASRLIEAVKSLGLNLRKKYCKHILKCFLLLVKNPGFQRYCRFDIQPMCQVALLICESLGNAATMEGTLEESTLDGDVRSFNTLAEELCSCIQSIYKITQQRSELKQQFVKAVLPALLKANPSLGGSNKFRSLFQELIIEEDIKLICEAFKSETKKKIPPHLKAVVRLLTQNEENGDLTTVASLLFDEYVTSCLKNTVAESQHISLFYILISVLGIELPLPYATVTAANLPISQRFSILAQLVAVLNKHNIPTSSESQEGVLSQNLILLLKHLLSGEYSVSTELLHAVVNIFKLHPESVRPVFSLIMLHVVLVRKEQKILKAYDNLMMNLVKIFSDLNRLDKFFELFFKAAVLVSRDHDFDGLTSEMLLSKGCYSVLSEKLTSFTGNQMKLIIERLEKIFSKEFIGPLESTCLQDWKFCLLLKLMISVLCHVLKNAPMFAATRWNVVHGNVQNIGLSIQRFGVAVLRGYRVKLSNKYELLLEFLQLVKVMADVELVANEYIISMSGKRLLPVVKSKDRSDDINNLSKSHGFLLPQEWIYIWEIIREALDRDLEMAWHDLLLQKVMKLGDKDILNHLVIEGVSDWLWATVDKVAPCVTLNFLELYTEKLLFSLEGPQQLAALDNINVLSNRAFRVAMIFQSLNHLVRSENSSLSGKLAKLFYIYRLMSFETQFSNEDLDEVNNFANALAEAINRHSWDDQPPEMLSPDSKQLYLRMFDVLTLMHSHCLKTETKRVLCLMVIGLSCDLRGESDLLPTILDYIMGCLDDTAAVVPDSLLASAVTRWLAAVVPPDYPHRRRLCTAALGRVLPSLAAAADECEALADEDLLCAALQALVEAHKTGRSKNNDEYKELAKKLISLASLKFNVRKPKPKVIRLFTSAVKADFLLFKKISSPLSTHLSKYLDILLAGLAGCDVMEPDAMELVELVLHPGAGLEREVVCRVCAALTEELSRTDVCPVLCYPSVVLAFVQALSTDEYQQTLVKIYDRQQKNVSSLCELWSVVVGAQEGKDKARIRDKLLVPVLAQCYQLVEQDSTRFHSNLLDLLHSIAAHKYVTLSPRLLDLMFVILYAAPLDSQPQLLPDSLSVLSALISVRAELVLDRVPVFLQRLRKCIGSLVRLSPAADGEMVTYDTVSSASINQVTRIIKTMTDHHAKHFARISPYLIADILHLLVTHSVETSVKGELQNSVCGLLSVCDHHGNQQLQNLLPVASVQLFKVVTTTYNKDFKYTGKV